MTPPPLPALGSLLSFHREVEVGFFDKLFGIGKENPARRSVEDGHICHKCGHPVMKGNMGFDTGSGQPLHLECPEGEYVAPE